MSSLAALLAALERETLEAAEAARNGEHETCRALLSRRAETLEALDQLGASSTAVSESAARALASDAELIAALSEQRESVRAALGDVRHARQTARGVARSDGTGRFICERV